MNPKFTDSYPHSVGATALPTLQIPNQIDVARCAMERMHKLCNQLEERLSRISRSEGPCNPVESACEREVCLTPLASELRDISNGINSANNRIESLLSRIEL